MVAKSVTELETIARGYVAAHFPALKRTPATRTERLAKTPGASNQYVFDFAGEAAGGGQRLRLTLDGDGQVVKVAASR